MFASLPKESVDEINKAKAKAKARAQAQRKAEAKAEVVTANPNAFLAGAARPHVSAVRSK